MVIKYSKDSLKFLSKLDKKSVNRIRAAIEDLTLTHRRVTSRSCKATLITENGCGLEHGASFLSTVLKVKLKFCLSSTLEIEETSISKEVVICQIWLWMPPA
mgnify:CR=1 FL=1